MAEEEEDRLEDEEEEECNASAEVNAKTLANRKKKMKKKEKEKQKTTDIVVTAPDGTKDALDPGQNVNGVECSIGSASASPALTPGASPQLTPSLKPQASPKLSPQSQPRSRAELVKLAHERAELLRRAEEEQLAREEEARRVAEEEKRREEEEEEAAQIAKQKKLDAKQEKVAAAKAQGTYMTKNQKLKVAKAAQAREQLLGSPCMKPKSPKCEISSPKVEGDSRNSPVLKNLDMLPPLLDACEEDPPIDPTLRSPIACIMGHVDTGKTKLLDKLRSTNVQQREAGGITQQIGATFFPALNLCRQINIVDSKFIACTPGLLVIDTPGHEAFNNLRTRGSNLCDIAILVVDVMHGLEPQTVESLELLRKQNCPFIIALNKIDLVFGWKAMSGMSTRDAIQKQDDFTKDQFQRRLDKIVVELNERGLNASLYWENEDPRDCISLVPTSAIGGEGIADLLYAIMDRAQSTLSEQLKPKADVQCSVLEVKNTEGLGTTIDVLLVNGCLHEGDQIVLAGMAGSIVTTVRALLTPQPMKEMRVKGEFDHHKTISAAMGVKISAAGLEKAVCGSEVFVVKDPSRLSELQENVQANFKSVLSSFEKQDIGVYVKASTIGSLEALLNFLGKENVPISHLSIGEVIKKDVTQAAIMREKRAAEYAVILAFDVKVNADAKKEAKNLGVQVFTADIIYHLFDQFQVHLEKTGKSVKPLHPAIFPVIMDVMKPTTVHKSESSLVQCQVTHGHLRLDTPLCYFDEDQEKVVSVGWVCEILKDRAPTEVAHSGDRICVKLRQKSAQEEDRDLDRSSRLCSAISRESNETLKEFCHSELGHTDWACLEMLKRTFKIS